MIQTFEYSQVNMRRYNTFEQKGSSFDYRSLETPLSQQSVR